MLGLAEYFAKIPRAQRQRTIVFLGSSGQHDTAPSTFTITARWMLRALWESHLVLLQYGASSTSKLPVGPWFTGTYASRYPAFDTRAYKPKPELFTTLHRR
jgi:hypothetical protein